MKRALLSVIFIVSSAAVSVGTHADDYQYPRKDCDEIFIGIAGLLKEADNQWISLKSTPEGSAESVERAEKLYWLTAVAANYTAVYEAFCKS